LVACTARAAARVIVVVMQTIVAISGHGVVRSVLA